jgi:hypothetical protein
MSETSDSSSSASRPSGIVGAARRVVAHGSALARLQRELAQTELQQKGATIGAGAALGVAAGIFALFAVGFGLATLAAALALVVDWWLALLIVFCLLVLVVIGLALGARALVRAGTPLKPVQAIEEAQRTKAMFGGGGA